MSITKSIILFTLLCLIFSQPDPDEEEVIDFTSHPENRQRIASLAEEAEFEVKAILFREVHHILISRIDSI